MSKQVTNDTISEFLKQQAEGDVTDFGYLINPNDAELNAEALSFVKEKWRIFLIEGGYEC